ncbi:MAG: protein kinase domain-containing protein [Kofleriaceae bacterium]
MDRGIATVPEGPEADWVETQIGRYTFRRLVGSGGMGVVVAAHDPELDREVAIKLVPTGTLDDERPVREAQAMAKLAHPNVVRVYEVIRLGARTAIVMELVDGEELASWQAREGRTWREIVDAYVQASRGLAAAHRAGIVHRDFKPSNALVDRDGIVRVTDFGIARRVSQEGAAPLDVAGTPVYMAPEQHRHEAIDARADQWSLACALYEALYGRRPFASSEGPGLADAVARGAIDAEPAESAAPRRVRAAIRRALSSDPDDRFASVDAFAAALATTPRRIPLVAGAAIAIVAIVVAIVLTRRDSAVCKGLDEPMSALWSDTSRAQLRERLSAQAVGLPAATVDRALRGLDGYATSWTTLRTRSCRDSQQGVLSAELLDARMRCLDHRLAEVSGLLEGLAAGDPATLRATSDAVAQLGPVSECLEPAAVARDVSPAAQTEIDAAENDLARANAAMSLGQYERALPLVERAIAVGETTHARSLIARALVIRGECEDRLGRFEAALATYRLAAQNASQARDHEVVADALARAFFVEGDHLGRRADALNARPFVELAVESAGQPDAVRAEWLHFLAILLYDDPTHVDEAARHERESLAIRQRTLPEGHVYVVDSMETLANVEASRGNYVESEQLLKRVLAARIASRGPSDSMVSSAYNNLGVLEVRRGNLATAIDYLQSAVDIANSNGQPNSAAVFNLAISQLDLGRWQAALTTFTSALALSERFGAESRDVAEAATFLGAVSIAIGDVERGRPILLRGVEAARRSQSPMLSTSLAHAARLALLDGDLATARALRDEGAALPTTNKGVHLLVAAELSQRDRGCAFARPIFVQALERSKHQSFERTTATVALAACERAAGDDGARLRLEAELAFLVAAKADEVVLAKVRAALATTR